MTYYALWITRDGKREFDGPFETNTEARQAMPGTARATLVTRSIPMTFSEYLDALPILEPRVQVITLTSPEVPEIDPRVTAIAAELGIPRRRP